MKSLILTGNLLLMVLYYLLSTPVKKDVEIKSSAPVFCSPTLDLAKLNAGKGPLIPGFTSISYDITSGSDSAKMFFNQGLSLLYAFNHGESGRSFKTAIELDSSAAMPYWGLAMVLGPNYNAALNPVALTDINAAISKAKKLAANATEKERELVDAMDARFPELPVNDMTPYNSAYALAMEKLYNKYPGDKEIAVLYVDALMNEHPWNLWLKDGTAQPWTPKIISTIEKVLERWPDHPGAIHYYIHAVEASKNAGKASAYADKLPAMMPTAGHLVHMPSHIYIRTGEYHKGVLVNEQASEADSNYISQCKASGFYPMLLYPHNIHFLAACAFLEGNSKKAIENAWRVSATADRKYLEENVTVQHFYSIPFFVLIHLGRWDEILKLEKPGEKLIYPKAIWHYARGMAYAGKKDMALAKAELEEVQKLLRGEVLKSQMIWDLNTASDIVSIAANVLEGEIYAQQKNYGKAIPLFRKAVAIEDKLNYNEPPDWFFSVRLTLGYWLLEAGNHKEAESVYNDDLMTFPENGWALKGLYNAQMGQGLNEAAAQTNKRFEKAWKWADIEIKSSRHFN